MAQGSFQENGFELQFYSRMIRNKDKFYNEMLF
jgi:hypothetical protein